MLGKLAFRNVRRSARDYLVYFITMTFVTALMFAFNSLIFTRDLEEMFGLAGIMIALVGLATFFIVLIVAWLINYMVRFMLEKRSQKWPVCTFGKTPCLEQERFSAEWRWDSFCSR